MAAVKGFRPRFNEQVNGYFICDAGRLSYKNENEDRLVEAHKKGKAIVFDDAIELARKAIDSAAKIVILLSPNLSIEQMVAAQAFAGKIGAEISGYSDNYVKSGDGDDYLIQDDKSANRAAFEKLGIDTTKAFFTEILEGANLLINIDNNLLDLSDKTLKKGLRDSSLIILSSHKSSLTEQAEIAIPVAS